MEIPGKVYLTLHEGGIYQARFIPEEKKLEFIVGAKSFKTAVELAIYLETTLHIASEDARAYAKQVSRGEAVSIRVTITRDDPAK
jgi:hypothetical protein